MKSRGIGIVLLILAGAVLLFGQSYSFRNYSATDGLPDNFIFHMLQDHEGYLWFATSTGVSRYNGVEFKSYTIRDGLADNSVRQILEDKQGRLWFATGGGLSCLSAGKFVNYSPKDGLPHPFIQTITQDKSGNIWIGTRGSGLSRFDGKQFVNFGEKEGMQGKVIWVLTIDRQGNLWIGNRETGPYRFDGKTFTRYSVNDGLPDNQVFSIHEDQSGRLWLGTAKGLCFFENGKFHPFEPGGSPLGSVSDFLQDRQGVLWFGIYGGGLCKYENDRLTTFRALNGLANDYVTFLTEDNEGTLWIGTQGGGISKFRTDRFANFTAAQGLCNGIIHALAQDRQHNYWFGSFGSGLCRFDGNKFTYYRKKDGLLSDLVEDIVVGNQGHIFIGTDAGLSVLRENRFRNYTVADGLPNNIIRCLRLDRKGRLWIGTFGGGVAVFDGKRFLSYSNKDGLSDDRVYTIYEDSSSRLWFGTDEGITLMENGEFHILSASDGLPAGKVSAITEAPDGTFWIGTDSGLSRYDGHRFRNYGLAEGLDDLVIQFLQFDRQGKLWIGTNKGVSVFDTTTEQFVNLNKRDGLVANETLLGAVLLDQDGLLWIGTTGGVTRCNPAVQRINTTPPRVLIEGVRVFEKVIPLDQTMRLRPDQNQLTFSFLAMSYADENRVRYQYLLEGFDTTWSPVTNLRSCRYTNLPHGKYRFRVRAANSDGVWNEVGAVLDLQILPHLYEKPGFQIALILASAGTLTGLFRWRVWRIRRLNQALEIKILRRTREVTEQKELLQKTNLELEALHNTSTAISSTLDKEELGRLILETSMGLLHCVGGFLFDYVWIRQSVVVTQAIGWSEDLKGIEVPLRNTLSQEIIESKESRVFTWQEIQQRISHETLKRALAPCQIVMVPMTCSERVVGVLVLGRDYPGAKFSQRDLSLLTSFANQAAVSIRNAQLYQAVRASESKHRTLIEQAGDAIFVMDTEGRFDSVNSMAVRLLGYTEIDYKLMSLFDLVSEGTRNTLKEEVSTLSGHAGLIESVDLKHKEGFLVSVEINAVKLDNGLIQAIVRDITERKKLEEDLAQQRDRAEEANRLKSEFLASVSHELRTPLHAILSFADFGLERVSNAERERLKHYFAEIKENGAMLLGLISDLLDLSKMEAGKMVYQRSPVTMRIVIEDACSRVYQLAETKEIQLSARAFPKVWMIYGDYEMLLRVVINLLGNAIKFTPRGGKVTIFALHQENEYICGIRDTGQGIYPDELESIFEKFAQGHQQDQKRHSGSGLGLSICRGIIEAHHGRIWAESDGPEKGSTFFFSVPVYQAENAGLESSIRIDEGSFI